MKIHASILRRLAAILTTSSALGLSSLAADAPAPPPASTDTSTPPAAATTTPPAPTDSTTGKHHRHHEARKQHSVQRASHQAWLGAIVENTTTPRKHGGSATRVEIVRITPGSPAEKAGIQKGDVLWKFEGRRLDTARQLHRELHALPPGQSVAVQILRNGKREDLNVKLGTFTDQRVSHAKARTHKHTASQREPAPATQRG
jgi:predicted metalloprotease with PDZ domain